jgi:sulfur relay (sulfurtransferase) DsrF/TusC family protein
MQKDSEFLMLSCSRCGTARGYLRSEKPETFHQSEDVIQDFLFCNLNRIIDKFEQNHYILSPTSIIIQKNNSKIQKNPQNNLDSPELIIFCTHSPYATEWTFGALSLAIASANHNIPTKVIFSENGIYSLTGFHNVNESDRIFNIQDIILATSDIEFLEYYAYKPSLKLRSMKIDGNLINDVKMINPLQLNKLIFDFDINNSYHKRIFFL